MGERRLSRALILLLVGGLLAACGGAKTADGQLAGTVLDPPFKVSATPLVGPDGQPYSLVDDTDRRLTLVFFGYTNCPDICGQVMATLAGAMARLDQTDREQVEVVFVTTDPARDTPAVVADYVARYDDSFVAVTGRLDDIVAVGKSIAVGVDKGEKLPSGGYDITHGTQITGIDASDEAPIMWSQDTSQAELAADVHKLLQAQ